MGKMFSTKRKKSEAGFSDPRSNGYAEASGQVAEEPQTHSLPGKQLVLSVSWAAMVLIVTAVEHGSDVANPMFWLSSSGLGSIALAGLPVVAALFLDKVVLELRELVRKTSHSAGADSVQNISNAAMSGKIVSIRHAVHRELATLNDHLERSLNKTSEIEASVKREVAALEKSFGDNERRLLALVQELARQRETVVITTDKVAGAVKASRESLNEELAQLATQVMQAGNYARGVARDVAAEFKADLDGHSAEVAGSLRHSLETEIGPLSAALGEQVQAISSLLSSGADGLVSAIEHHGLNLAANVNSTWERISSDLDTQSASAGEIANRLQSIVSQGLESNVNQLESRIRSASIEVRAEMDNATELTAQKILDLASSSSSALDSRIATLQTEIDTQLGHFTAVVDKASGGILPTIQRHNEKLERVIELESAFETRTESLRNVLTDQAAAFVQILSASVTTFQEQFDDQAKNVSEGLLGKLDWAVATLEDGSRRFETTLLDVQDTISIASDKLTISVAEQQSQFAQGVNQLEALVFEGAERIDEHLTKGVTGLSSALEGGARQIEGAFAERTDHMTLALSTALGSADLLLQEQITDLEGLNAKHEANLRSVLGAVVDSMDSAVASSDHMLVSASASIQRHLVDGSSKFADGLAEMKSKLDTDLVDFATAMRESLTRVGAEEASSLATRMTEIGGAVQTHVNTVYSSLDARSREFEANIAQFGANIDTQTSRLQRVITQKAESIEQAIGNGIEQFGVNFQAHLEAAEQTATQLLTQDEAKFQKQLSGLKELLSDQTTSIDQRTNAIYLALDGRGRQFESRLAEYGEILEKQVDTLQSAVVERSRKLENSIELGNGRVSDLLTSKLSQTQKLVDDFVESESDNFDRQIKVLSSTLDGRSQILESIMRTRGADFTDQLYASSRHLEEELTSTSRSLESAFHAGSSEMQHTLSAQVNELQQAVGFALQRSKADSETLITTLGRLLSGGASGLRETLQANLTTMAESLEGSTATLGALLEGGTEAISETLAQRGREISEGLAKRSSEIDADLERRIAELETRLTARSNDFAVVLDARASTLHDLLEGGADSIARTLGQHGKLLVDVLSDGAGNLETDLGRRVVDLETRLLTQTNAIATALDSGSVALDQLIDGATSKLSRTLTQHGKHLGDVLADGAGAIDSDFARRVARVEAELESQTEALVSALDSSATKVGAAVEHASRELDKNTRERMADAKAALQSAADATGRVLSVSVDATQQKLASSLDTLISRLALHEKVATGRMESAAASVGESTRKAAEQTAERLVTVNGALAQVLTSLGSQRSSARRGKAEVLPIAAE